MKKKWLGKMLCATVIASMLVGCSSGDTSTSSSSDGSNASIGTQEAGEEIVTLKWYMSLNPISPDTNEVIEALNEYTREKIGVEIDYTVIANPDYKEKMPTYINSGEYFDICFTANWTTNYTQFVGRDAFLDITELLPVSAAETYEFIPEAIWQAVTVNDGIYGVPSYKEMGWQGGLFINTDIADEYGIDLTTVKSLDDLTAVLAIVKEQSVSNGVDMIGVAGLGNNMGFSITNPYESLVGTPAIPGAAAVPEYNNFQGMPEVFNQYASDDYMEYCKTVREWYENGYTSADPVQYDSDIASRANDFKTGKLFSYIVSFAPGATEAEIATTGHGVTYIPLNNPLCETRTALGGLLAISSGSDYPEKALEFINLLNTDEYVGTLIRHGIEGKHYSLVGDNQVDVTMDGTISTDEHGYIDYKFGWQFGTPFNQKWDISYPDNIEEMFVEHNEITVVSPNNGFSFDATQSETVIAALTNVVAEYSLALETGMIDPEENIPKFLSALEANGVDDLLTEIEAQLQQ